MMTAMKLRNHSKVRKNCRVSSSVSTFLSLVKVCTWFKCCTETWITLHRLSVVVVFLQISNVQICTVTLRTLTCLSQMVQIVNQKPSFSLRIRWQTQQQVPHAGSSPPALTQYTERRDCLRTAPNSHHCNTTTSSILIQTSEIQMPNRKYGPLHTLLSLWIPVCSQNTLHVCCHPQSRPLLDIHQIWG